MARFAKLRPVKSEKEEITWSDLAINASTVQRKAIVTAVDSPTTAGQVEIGDTVSSVYFEFHFSAQVVTNPKVIHWTIQKVPAGIAAMKQTPSTYDEKVKRFIFKRGMEMLPASQSTVFKRIFVVRIPPRFKRFGDGDLLEFSYISTSTETINACGIAIYKHFG